MIHTRPQSSAGASEGSKTGTLLDYADPNLKLEGLYRLQDIRCCNRLVEEADFRAAQELFGGQDLDKMQPKSAKDFEDYAAALVHKYVAAHSRSPHYKTLVKALLKVGSMRLSSPCAVADHGLL